jgi:hypothetical protein
MNFRPNPNGDVNGTSFHEVTIHESLDFMVKRLGKPHFENGPSDKIRYEWIFFSDDGRAVTVYDWKTGSSKPKIWNVGGLTKEITVLFKEWFNEVR